MAKTLGTKIAEDNIFGDEEEAEEEDLTDDEEDEGKYGRSWAERRHEIIRFRWMRRMGILTFTCHVMNSARSPTRF